VPIVLLFSILISFDFLLFFRAASTHIILVPRFIRQCAQVFADEVKRSTDKKAAHMREILNSILPPRCARL
jgi:hypothetical protein